MMKSGKRLLVLSILMLVAVWIWTVVMPTDSFVRSGSTVLAQGSCSAGGNNCSCEVPGCLCNCGTSSSGCYCSCTKDKGPAPILP